MVYIAWIVFYCPHIKRADEIGVRSIKYADKMLFFFKLQTTEMNI